MKATCLAPDQIEVVLKQAGINPTAQRIAICRFVLCEADHPSADDIKHWVDLNFPKLSLATVYNTLRVLVEAGLIRELRLPHSDRVLYDQDMTPHFHFLDEGSGLVEDIPPGQVALHHELPSDYRVDGVEVLLRGRRS